MKNKNHYISIILSTIISLLLIAPMGTALAQEPEAPKEAEKSAVASIDDKGTCYSTLDDTQKTGLVTGQLISTEVEEALVKAGDIGQAVVKTCYRVTACKEGDTGKTQCVSFLNTKCEVTSGQTSLAEERSKIKVASKPQSCEKMQLIISPAGAGLLYAYIGMVYKWVASIVGVVAVLLIVIGGIQISAAGGDPGKVDEAKGRIFKALGGIALLFLSGLILYTINPTFFIR